MIRDAQWKYADFPDAPARLFDMQADPDETTDRADAEAEVARAMQAQLDRFGSWDHLAQQQASDKARWGKFELIGHSAVQYRLADQRVIDADDHLYDGSSLKHSE